MEHCTRQGLPRILETCAYPLTAARVVKRIYTELAVIDVSERLEVIELAKDVTFEYLQGVTGAKLHLTQG